MKKNLFTLFCCSLLALLFLTRCQKPYPSAPCLPPVKLSKITGLMPYHADTLHFTYNALGNPTAILRSFVSTGYPNQLFRYDKHNRLAVVIGAYDTPYYIYEFARKFVYDNAGRIIRDTGFVFGRYNPEGEPIIKTGDTIWIHHFTYDYKNRINKEIAIQLYHHQPAVKTTREFYYNADGNLYKVHRTEEELPPLCNTNCVTASDEYFEYDNNINFHQLHPIWQFIDRDYSRNNPFKATTYNNFGLPVKLGPPSHGQEYQIFDNQIRQAELHYQY
ncbi:hypothetical protein [Chitinophaga flava]|uniref:DUF4595 domain-containing protein n=1 Tax=Chitinophaga flava TaxID=2259036 RepID=A0A365XQL3_9BACT|nr:hypothetical protein [Chitinophaga flava]RBL88420.1 hypothetical protein DF182_17670 [Chitinophaga flava]